VLCFAAKSGYSVIVVECAQSLSLGLIITDNLQLQVASNAALTYSLLVRFGVQRKLN